MPAIGASTTGGHTVCGPRCSAGAALRAGSVAVAVTRPVSKAYAGGASRRASANGGGGRGIRPPPLSGTAGGWGAVADRREQLRRPRAPVVRALAEVDPEGAQRRRILGRLHALRDD